MTPASCAGLDGPDLVTVGAGANFATPGGSSEAMGKS